VKYSVTGKKIVADGTRIILMTRMTRIDTGYWILDTEDGILDLF